MLHGLTRSWRFPAATATDLLEDLLLLLKADAALNSSVGSLTMRSIACAQVGATVGHRQSSIAARNPLPR